MANVGHVTLVGAGPGHPGLLTRRGHRRLAQADVIVYDRLLSPRLLNFANPAAKAIYVGKASGHHTLAQADIETLLVEHAAAGRHVVRLKGGDPFVFGRGSEEILALRAAGIPYEVVPGVTSAVAVPAFAGIPLTHRNLATSFQVVTGHQCLENADEVNWASMKQSTASLVILMGLSQIAVIMDRLRAGGLPSDMPVAVIHAGTRAAQSTRFGTIATIVASLAEQPLPSPAIIVVGDVVRLADAISSVPQQPLFGRRILIAADTPAEAEALAESVEDLGGEAFEIPRGAARSLSHITPGLDAFLHLWSIQPDDLVWIHDETSWQAFLTVVPQRVREALLRLPVVRSTIAKSAEDLVNRDAVMVAGQ